MPAEPIIITGVNDKEGAGVIVAVDGAGLVVAGIGLSSFLHFDKNAKVKKVKRIILVFINLYNLII